MNVLTKNVNSQSTFKDAFNILSFVWKRISRLWFFKKLVFNKLELFIKHVEATSCERCNHASIDVTFGKARTNLSSIFRILQKLKKTTISSS